MTTYYRTTDAALRDLTADEYAALAQSKRDTLRVYSIDPQPTPSATQYVVAGPVVVDATTARKTWELRAKSAEQIEADTFAAAQAAALAAATAPAVYRALRDGTGTAGERLVRVERVCAWLLRQQVGREPA